MNNKCTFCEKELTAAEFERNLELGRDEYSNLFCDECEDVPAKAPSRSRLR